MRRFCIFSTVGAFFVVSALIGCQASNSSGCDCCGPSAGGSPTYLPQSSLDQGYSDQSYAAPAPSTGGAMPNYNGAPTYSPPPMQYNAPAGSGGGSGSR